MDIDIAVEISRLYVSFFNRAADPEGLQYWISRYEQELAKGRSGALFLEDMADSFAQSPEAKALYATSDNPSQEEIRSYITDAYFNMFGRVPDDEGLDYWASRWQTELDAGRPGVRVLFEIENAARGSQNEQDKEALKNKAEIAAQFTDEFIKSGATWEEGDVAKAKDVVAKVDHTPESVQQASQEIAEFIEDKTNEGQEPVDDGDDDDGGVPVDNGPPQQLAATLSDGVITIASGASVTLTENEGEISISRAGYSTATFDKDVVSAVHLDSNAVVNVSASGKFVAFTGEGVVNVSAGELGDAKSFEDKKINYSDYIEELYNIGYAANGVKIENTIDIQVNGNEGDTIKALWDLLDDRYYPPTGTNLAIYTDKNINESLIRLGNRYVEFLKEGGEPFLDFSAKYVEGSRNQSLHDSILGKIDQGSVRDRGFTADEIASFGISPEYFERGYISGYTVIEDRFIEQHLKAWAFDYALGLQRDYPESTFSIGGLDKSAVKTGTTYMWNASSVDALDGFLVSRNEAAGLELALRVKDRSFDSNNDVLYSPETKTYSATGGKWTSSKTVGDQVIMTEYAHWSFDLSVASGLNSSKLDLDDFDIYLKIDIDKTEDQDFVWFRLSDSNEVVGFESFVFDETKSDIEFPEQWSRGFSDNVGSLTGESLTVAQNSQNYAFGWINDLIVAKHGELWGFYDATFDIELVAFRGDQEVLQVGTTVNVLGLPGDQEAV